MMELPMEMNVDGVPMVLSKVSYSPMLDFGGTFSYRRYCFVGELQPEGYVNWFFAPLEGYKDKRLRVHESAVKEGALNHLVFMRLGELSFRQYKLKHIPSPTEQPHSPVTPQGDSTKQLMGHAHPHFNYIFEAMRQDQTSSPSPRSSSIGSDCTYHSSKESCESLQMSSSLVDLPGKRLSNASLRSGVRPPLEARRGAVCDDEGFLPPVRSLKKSSERSQEL
ncbi:hypothetical protein, conserved [Trypanosoma brucei gambiense DAL972]|uniref:Uncharacterized protein n=2 Tax=Trypanosoma brucei TaxID=5691 RepID=C9ZLV3_TRYB9|nr:hypothetical protein, conserved [Trypanosoma brucei gambiense DAL972]RHW73056.1 hypothetical protein DPX39_040012400 [Trypanosoma brucei equiperdum]CBH10378.1 hypothetical protein, conserved [Trypanosoma brucei gambiense DAL972]|eukprot:XP_011772668.1 hypothetical protein, conserved [Trypanosoma brucei gambiense DAL972]